MTTLEKISINGNEYTFNPLASAKTINPTFCHGSDVFETYSYFVQISNLVICYIDVRVLSIPSDAIRDDDVKRYRIPFVDFDTDMDGGKYTTIQLTPFKCDMPRSPAFAVPSPSFANRLNLHVPIEYNANYFHGVGFIFLKK